MSLHSFCTSIFCLSLFGVFVEVNSTSENACNDNDMCEIDSTKAARSAIIEMLEDNLSNTNIVHFERYGYEFIWQSGVFSPVAFDASAKEQVSPFFPIIENETVFLDMGCGTGYYGITAVLKGAKYGLGLDINENAISNTQANAVLHNLGNDKNRYQVFKSSLFSIFNDKSDENASEMELPTHSVFDIMYFDIPWHASDDEEEKFAKLHNKHSSNTEKDKKVRNLLNSIYDADYQVARKFLKDAKKYLRKDPPGAIYIFLSDSVADMELFNKTVKDNGYSQVLYQEVIADSYPAQYWELRAVE